MFLKDTKDESIVYIYKLCKNNKKLYHICKITPGYMDDTNSNNNNYRKIMMNKVFLLENLYFGNGSANLKTTHTHTHEHSHTY